MSVVLKQGSSFVFMIEKNEFQRFYFSRATSSSNRKDAIAPIFPMTHNGHCD